MRTITTALASTLFIAADRATGGVVDPDCTVETAAKSAAMKSTVGVCGRCSPKAVAAATAKHVTGIEDKWPIEKRRDDDKSLVKKVVK